MKFFISFVLAAAFAFPCVGQDRTSIYDSVRSGGWSNYGTHEQPVQHHEWTGVMNHHSAPARSWQSFAQEDHQFHSPPANRFSVPYSTPIVQGFTPAVPQSSVQRQFQQVVPVAPQLQPIQIIPQNTAVGTKNLTPTTAKTSSAQVAFEPTGSKPIASKPIASKPIANEKSVIVGDADVELDQTAGGSNKKEPEESPAQHAVQASEFETDEMQNPSDPETLELLKSDDVAQNELNEEGSDESDLDRELFSDSPSSDVYSEKPESSNIANEPFVQQSAERESETQAHIFGKAASVSDNRLAYVKAWLLRLSALLLPLLALLGWRHLKHRKARSHISPPPQAPVSCEAVEQQPVVPFATGQGNSNFETKPQPYVPKEYLSKDQQPLAVQPIRTQSIPTQPVPTQHIATQVGATQLQPIVQTTDDELQILETHARELQQSLNEPQASFTLASVTETQPVVQEPTG